MLPVDCFKLCYIFLAAAFLDMNMVYSVTNSDFNEGIRKHSIKENNTSENNVTTLLKQGKERYSHFVPIPNPATFKQEPDIVPDNELSSSSYSRGLLHHSDYGSHDYDDGPHHGYAYDYNYNIHDTDGYGHHGFDHHSPVHFHSNHHVDHHVEHHGGHHGGHHYVGHHSKHYDHGLAAKALLWPIAGIALLGAAAAFVTNPVLLQLGVVSGRRRRRDTEEATGPDDIDVEKWSPKEDIAKNSETIQHKNFQRQSSSKFYTLHGMSKIMNKQNMENVTPEVQASESNVSLDISGKRKLNTSDNFIPIPLKMKPFKKL